MNITIKNFINENPQFHDAEPPIMGDFLLTENRSISRLKPSGQIQNKLILFIQQIFQRVLKWLYPFEPINYVGIVTALDKTTQTGFNTLTQKEMLAYFQRFFKSENLSSPHLLHSINQLQEQYQAFETFGLAKGFTPSKFEFAKEQLQKSIQCWISKVQGLKEGEQSVILAREIPGDELFYLFSKKEGKIHFKIIGRGHSIVALSKLKEVAVAGQTKIVSCLDYGCVDEKFAEQVISHSPLGLTLNQTSDKALDITLEKLLEHKEPVEQFKNLETATNNVCDVFWSVFNQINQNEKQITNHSDRLKIRLEIFTLFSLFNEYRYTLRANPSEVHTLSRMFRICSQELAGAYQKGLVSKQEVDEIVEELKLVQKAIDEASVSISTPISTLKMDSMDIYPAKTLSPITLPTAIAEPKVQKIPNCRYPNLAPPSSLKLGTAVFIRSPSKLNPSLSIVDRLKSLAIGSSPQQIVKDIYALDFSAFYEDVHRHSNPLDTTSDWAKFSASEANEILNNLSILSKRIVDFSIQEKELPIDMYETLIKMSYMICFLTHFILKKQVYSHEAKWLMGEILRFGRIVSSCFYNDGNRYGQNLHSSNVQTNNQMHSFYRGMLDLQAKSDLPSLSSADRISLKSQLSEKIEGLEILQEQVELLKYLTPYYLGDEKGGSLTAALHGWIVPLPISLLAVYQSMGMKVGTSSGKCTEEIETTFSLGCTWTSYRQVTINPSYRNTPEGIQHDPESVLREYEEYFLKEEMGKWRENVEAEILGSKAPWGRGSEQDILLNDSPYAGEARKRQIKALLKKQEEYIFKATQASTQFSKEELTALLSLLRMDKPQKEVLAFIETQAHLLSNPVVRSFIQLIFFNPSLLETLQREFVSERSDRMDFCQTLPRFIAEKITEYKQKAAENPSEMGTLLYFMQMSDKLKGIYEVLQKTETKGEHKYDTQGFFSTGDDEIQSFIQMQREKDPSALASVEMIAIQLKALFAKPQLTQKELCQIILDMDLLKAKAHQVSSFEYRELFWIKGSYQELMQEIPSILEKEQIHFVLDTLCYRKGLVLDQSEWNGNFPVFFNSLYRVNLETNSIEDLTTASVTTTLPSSILINPLFRKNFPEFSSCELKAMKSETADGTQIYFFEDLQKNSCRIEEREGTCSFYRSFPKTGHSNMLQSAEFGEALFDGSSINSLLKKGSAHKEHGMFDMIKSLFQSKEADLPAILKQRLYIDPKYPGKGFIVSDDGEMQFEVRFKPDKNGAKIESVIDLREGKDSKPMQLMGLNELNHPVLKQLGQFENPAHVLIWGGKGTVIEKIEMPRFGLTFVLKNDALVCINPKFAGYRVQLSASQKERKGFAFSLILEHPDRSRPKKLILPPTRAIIQSSSLATPHSGLAFILWCIKSTFSLLFTGTLPNLKLFPHFQLHNENEKLNYTVIDLCPHTEELTYEQGQATVQSQELISQAVKLGDFDLALEVLRSIEIENDERILQKWIYFLSNFEKSRFDAVIGLKIAEKLFDRIKGQKKHKGNLEKLKIIETKFFIIYLEEASKLVTPLRLLKGTFKRIADDLKKSDSHYYDTHVAPFFMRVGESFTLQSIAIGLTGKGKLPKLIDSREEELLKELSEISELENQILPGNTISKLSLSRELSLDLSPGHFLFDSALIATYFKSEEEGVTSENNLLNQVVIPKSKKLKKEKIEAKKVLNALLFSPADHVEQLAIYAQEKKIANASDLLIALVQKDFESLQLNGLLPKGIDLEELKKAVIHFYDLEVKYNLIFRCKKELSTMVSEKSLMAPSIWKARSSQLLELINYKRQYIPEENPELLAFEALHFVTLRDTTHPTQLELLQQLLKDSSSIIQAGTGTGKSSVLSVLRGFMRANGENLVTQKVLPHLYQESLAILQNRLGNLKGKLYPLLFNQSMPLHDKEGNSLFAQIYLNLLETIRNKGCVLTDYKSLPLLEQKFLAISKQIAANCDNNVENPAILITHWFYLRKILILLENRDDQLMDEFDQPMSAVQRIQTQMREGAKFEHWMIEESMALYELLLKERSLMLAENLQGDIPEKKREECIQKIAKTIAKQKEHGAATEKQIYSYLIGQSEEVLENLHSWTLEQKDALVFLKDQFTTYLPLTLNRSSSSHYTRSKDGKKIITCTKGEQRDAKFGNVIEEINYTIQDYFQQKVALSTLREWMIDAKKDWSTLPEAAQERFAEILPGVSLAELAYLPPDDFEDRIPELLEKVNQNPSSVNFFLKRHLQSLRSSGIVISMNPQDCVAMSLAVSGVSATVGSLGSLHDQFQKDVVTAEKLQEAMIDRIRSRSYGDPIRYNPLDPLAILQKVKDPAFCALIDGSGAFRSIPPTQVAQALLEANSTLKRVEFYDNDGSLNAVGASEAPLHQKGFYYPEVKTRGSDQVLRPDGVALHMATEKGDIEDFIQEEGRMRHPQQKVLVALSGFASPDRKTLDDLLVHKKENEKRKLAEDRYRAEPQRLRQFMRHAARKELLHANDIGKLQKLLEAPNIQVPLLEAELIPFLNRFKQLESLFIQSISVEEKASGEYFQKHQRLIHRNADPVQELQALKNSLIADCQHFGISKEKLEQYDPKELAPHLPHQVLPLYVAENQQQEVQEELELNNQFEMEMDEEQQRENVMNQSKVDSYLPRLRNGGKSFSADQLHPAFSPKIKINDAYLPLNRVDALHKRKAFDDRTYRVGFLNIYMKGWEAKEIESIAIGDPLDDIDNSNECRESGSPITIEYDIRTGIAVSYWGMNKITAITKNPEFKFLLVQIKFLDGRTDGYTSDELDHLREWLEANGVEEMRHFFSKTILKNRPEQRFPHSQLWKIFKELLLVV